jgi:hypothetical protein
MSILERARGHLADAMRELQAAKNIRAGDDSDRQVSIAFTHAEEADLRVAQASGLVPLF